MKKADRDKVFNKYGGKCAYCGCELEKGWHVDHIEQVSRKKKRIPFHYKHLITGEEYFADRFKELYYLPEEEKEHIAPIQEREVPDGYSKPQNDCLENMNPSCASCNINKHVMTIEEFRKAIAKFVESLNQRMVQYKIAKRYGLIQETGKEVKFYFESHP